MDTQTMEPFKTRSEQVNELMGALVRARAKFHPIIKDTDAGGGQRRYKYATLDQVIAAITPALIGEGLFISDVTDAGYLIVTLDHAPSGQWKRSRLPIPDPMVIGWQDFGAGLTYARRYQYAPMVGVATEDDDDAQGADANHKRRQAETVPDPLERLWHALADKGINKESDIRGWIEMVLAKPTPTPDCITPAEATLLINVATGKAPMPSPTVLGKADASHTVDTVALAKDLNTALNTLAPWGKAIQGKSARDAATIKQTAKLDWANGMRPGAKHVSGFGELTADELVKLIAHAKVGDMPTSQAAVDDEPDWLKKELT
jgi:ERF superfamily